MRDYNFKFVGQRFRQLGGGGLAVGDITWAFANPDAAHYQDALVSQTLTVPPYTALLAMQGPLFGKVRPFPQNAANSTTLALDMGCVWKGALYSATGNGAILKRANMAAAFTAVPGIAPTSGFSGKVTASYPLGTFLLIETFSNPNGFLTVATSDTVKSATVLIGGGGITPNIHSVIEGVAANTLIALSMNAGAIYRTTNGGATWALITGALSVPADRVWLAGWKNGANLHMLGAQGVIATSTDDGATWTVNTAVPGATPLYQPAPSAVQNYTTTCFDKRPGVLKGYFLGATGGVYSWSLTNPGAGFTQETAPGGLSLTNARFASIKAGLFAANDAGFFFAAYANLIAFTLVVTAAVLQAAPNYVLNSGTWVSAMGLRRWSWATVCWCSTTA